MGKVKIKKKSTFIDMTAMSDVTVLLLTFFMSTSTFLQKEPTIVYTPSSVSEIKVPEQNLVTVLISSSDKSGNLADPNITEGKIFISFAGGVDSTQSSEKIREQILLEAVGLYNTQHPSRQIQLTEKQVSEFTQINMFGVPFAQLPEYLSLDVTTRDEFQGDMTNPLVGIPIDGNKDRTRNLNDFQIWMQAIYNVAKDIDSQESAGLTDDERKSLKNLYSALMRHGEGIAVKADKDTPFEVVHLVFDNLQTMKLNKFSLMTALKSEDEPTQ